jgi:hypothetical protein
MHPCHKNPRTGRLSNQDWLQRACVPERGNHTRQATPQRGLANHWTHQGSICTALAWGLVDQFTQHATPLVVWHTPGFSTGQGLCFELTSRILHYCPKALTTTPGRCLLVGEPIIVLSHAANCVSQFPQAPFQDAWGRGAGESLSHTETYRGAMLPVQERTRLQVHV